MDVKSLTILKCFYLLFSYFNPYVEGDVPFGLCANPTCSVPVSHGITTLRYTSPDNNKISINIGEEVEIYVKEYGPKKDLLGIQHKGRKGYISKGFIKETATLKRDLVPAAFDFKNPVLSDSKFVTSQTTHHEFWEVNDASTSLSHSEIIESSINNPHSISHQIANGPSETIHFAHTSQFPSTGHVHSDMDVHHIHSSDILNFHEHSSHFDLNSGKILPSSDIESTENLSPPSQTPDIIHSPIYDSHKFESYSSSSFNKPNNHYKDSQDYFSTYDYDNPSVSIETSSDIYSSLHQNQPWQEDYQSNYDIEDDIDEEEFSKTFAMLSERGIEKTSIFDSVSNLKIHLSSQNNEIKHSMPEPSQSHFHLPNKNTESFVINKIEPTVKKENILNSHSLKDSDENIDAKFSETVNIHNLIKDDKINTENTLNSYSSRETENIHNHIKKDNDNVNNKNLEENLDEILADDDEEKNEDDGEERNEDGGEGKNEDDYLNNEHSDINLENNIEHSKLNLESSMNSVSVSHKESQKVIDNSELNGAESFYDESSIFKTQSSNEELWNNNSSEIGESNIVNTFTDSKTNSHIIDSRIPKYSVEDTSSSTDSSTYATKTVKEEIIIEPNKIKNNLNYPNNLLPENEFPSEANVIQEENTNLSNKFYSINKNYQLNESFDSSVKQEEVSSTYQTRNLKQENIPNEDHQSDIESNYEENNTEPEFYTHERNSLDSIKSIIDTVMSWIPEPLYSSVMDLQNKGISPRVPVFTAMCGFIIIFLIVPVFYIKEWSKESKLSAQLAELEKNVYTLSATNTVLEEKLECAQSELKTLQESLEEERNISSKLRIKFDNQTEEFENIKSEIESYLEEIDSLRGKETEYLSLLNVQNKEKEDLMDHKSSLEKLLKDREENLASLSEQLQENENSIKELEKEKKQFIQLKEDYEEKLAQFELNCNQLLREAEVWNLRVNELTSKLNEEKTSKEEIEASLKSKDEEIESLKQLVETFKTFDEIEDPEELEKSKEEKLQNLMKSSMILSQLKKQEDENKVLYEQLGKEKEKILEMEVDMLEAKSEIDKLKMSYNQALQDKAEAQTKLDVLTNYFKDKEIQLQKQLGAQEAVRQKKEEDAMSAERRICLIEQENASYKYQVASMKQEMEETERNLKSQIAVQEKKAHENWIAARAAERKLEDMKQEVTQLRQRLTLLEREQENLANSSRDEIVRPLPKRMNDESGSQDLNTSERNMFHPPLDRMPPPHMMLPPDRPLPPLLPPPMPPMFLPPMERHFRPQPWHIPPDSGSDFRTTPPEFITGRESTPPRGRPTAAIDGESGPHASSPLTTDTRDSRNSTPPHLLPDFHDIPPLPGRPFFPPPPLGHPRMPMHPQFRREGGPVHKRIDNPNEYNLRGPQPPPATSQEQWQHSRA